jgi:hypothetical protein
MPDPCRHDIALDASGDVLVDDEGLTSCCQAYTSIFIDDEVEYCKCCGRDVTGYLGNAVFDMPVRYKSSYDGCLSGEWRQEGCRACSGGEDLGPPVRERADVKSLRTNEAAKLLFIVGGSPHKLVLRDRQHAGGHDVDEHVEGAGTPAGLGVVGLVLAVHHGIAGGPEAGVLEGAEKRDPGARVAVGVAEHEVAVAAQGAVRLGEDVPEKLLVGVGPRGADEPADDGVAVERSGRLAGPCPEQVGQLSVVDVVMVRRVGYDGG